MLAIKDWIFVGVAPFTGEWIETGADSLTMFFSSVAPFTGAWIETLAIVLFTL